MAIRHSSRTTPPRRFRPRVEVLESRLPLAGGVLAVQYGGDLYLSADDLPNRLWIVCDSEGSFAVQAIDCELNGQYGATIPFVNVRNISLDMRGGDDIVSIIQTKLTGALRFSGGNGNDQLWFGYGNKGDHFLGRLFANLGAGNDHIGASDENSFTIRQSMVVQGGEGNNSIFFDTDMSVTLGNVAIIGGSQNDVVSLGDGHTSAKSIVMVAGGGYNSLGWSGSATIAGNIIQVGRGEQDIFSSGVFSQQQTTIAGAIYLQHGEGSNDVQFWGSTSVEGPILMSAGSGDDEFVVKKALRGSHDNHFAARDINLQIGDGSNSISFDLGTSEVRNLTVNSGAGLDRVSFFDFRPTGSVSLAVGDGDNVLVVINSEILGAFAWSSGNGQDRIRLESGYSSNGKGSVFRASLYLSLGDGNDSLYVGGSEPDTLSFEGSTFFGGGLGDDFLISGGNEEYVLPPIIDSF